MIAEMIRSFDCTLVFMQQQVADLSDKEIVLQPAGVPNHAAWTLGHVIHSCQVMAGQLGVAAWLPGDWESCFGYGSSPDNLATSSYASKVALVASLTEAGNRLREALLATDESRFGEALSDESTREILPTIGHVLLQVVCAHTAFHAGQLAVWRRAIGRRPVGVFI